MLQHSWGLAAAEGGSTLACESHPPPALPPGTIPLHPPYSHSTPSKGVRLPEGITWEELPTEAQDGEEEHLRGLDDFSTNSETLLAERTTIDESDWGCDDGNLELMMKTLNGEQKSN